MKTLLMTALTIVLSATFSTAEANSPSKNVVPSSSTLSIEYPEKAKRYNEEGRVLVHFQIADGKVNNVNVISNATPELDKAAVKMVNDLPSDFIAELEKLEQKDFILPVTFDIR